MKIYILIVLSLVFSTVSMADAYGVNLSNEEKITALTSYFAKKDFKIRGLSLPPKPTKPAILKAKVITKSKYEKIRIYEERVKAEEENHLRIVQSRENKYQQSLREYDINVEKITNNYNSKNKIREDKIKYKAKQKAYTTVYGNPYIAKKSLDYDAEKEVFNAELKSTKDNFLEKIIIEVSVNEAEEFEKNVNRMKLKVAFEVKENSEKLKYIVIKSSKNRYIGKLK